MSYEEIAVLAPDMVTAADAQFVSKIADILEAIADSQGWDEELYQRLNDLLEQREGDPLLDFAYGELIHYSGEFDARNLLGLKKKPEVADYRETFRDISDAIHKGTTWEQCRRANNMYESGDFMRRLKGLFSG